MKIQSNLILAKQQASQAKGQNFYVTKTDIKRDYDLLNSPYIYKVYFKNGINVEDSKGKKIESPKTTDSKDKTSVSSKLRDSKNAKVNENDEPKQS